MQIWALQSSFSGLSPSAGGSGVHSCFRAWRRLPPAPALWAALKAYYSPSQPFSFRLCSFEYRRSPWRCQGDLLTPDASRSKA